MPLKGYNQLMGRLNSKKMNNKKITIFRGEATFDVQH